MARKVFWILWVTVWPAVAIIPPLINAQAPVATQKDSTDRSVEFPTKRTPAISVSDDSGAAANSEGDIPAEATSPANSLAEPVEAVEVLPATPNQNVKSNRRPAAPPVSKQTAKKPATELLPDNENRNVQTATPKASVRLPRESATRQTAAESRVLPTNRAELTAHEEQAQKLLHERAAVRGMQRQLRLEAKYRNRQAPSIPVQATRWQPQLTETNWADLRRAGRL